MSDQALATFILGIADVLLASMAAHDVFLKLRRQPVTAALAAAGAWLVVFGPGWPVYLGYRVVRWLRNRRPRATAWDG